MAFNQIQPEMFESSITQPNVKFAECHATTFSMSQPELFPNTQPKRVEPAECRTNIQPNKCQTHWICLMSHHDIPPDSTPKGLVLLHTRYKHASSRCRTQLVTQFTHKCV